MELVYEVMYCTGNKDNQHLICDTVLEHEGDSTYCILSKQFTVTTRTVSLDRTISIGEKSNND